MKLRSFLAPQITSIILLSLLWFSGTDTIYSQDQDHEKNLRKYVQVQQRVMDNYFDVPSLDALYRESIIGIVRHLEDSTLVVAGTPIDTSFAGQETIKDIRGAYMGFRDAYTHVLETRPEEDMDALTESAIRQMMSKLDPHSVYIEPDDSERIQEEFAGKFQGIGIQFNIIADTITVVTPISGGPSDRLGIRSGDRIIEINDTSAVGYTNEDVQRRLRGEKGTTVDVTILRPGARQTLPFTITRDDIPITTVDTHYMLDEHTGYVKINRFAATTHEEFMASVADMRRSGMDRLMVDLRSNPGGYLSQAIAIAEEFFPAGTVLVGTTSRHARFTSSYESERDGQLLDMPVIVLVNEGSASASEIVSGAIQDHDRGLIIGKRTFGKGLVQQQYPLVDESNIRVTISRYYTPSGRLIQKPFKDGIEAYAHEIIEREHSASKDAMEFIDQVPDSLVYFTTSGRTVYGGGGIIPDHVIEEDTTLSGYLFNFMIANQVDFNFVREYLDGEGDTFRARWKDDFEGFRRSFEWSPEDQDRFLDVMTEKGLVIDDTLEEPAINGDTLSVPLSYIEETAWMAYGRMKAELARQVWGTPYFYPVINDVFGEFIKEAMLRWDDVEKLETFARQQAQLKASGAKDGQMAPKGSNAAAAGPRSRPSQP